MSIPDSLLGIVAAFVASYAVVGLAAAWQRCSARRQIERRIDQLRSERVGN